MVVNAQVFKLHTTTTVFTVLKTLVIIIVLIVIVPTIIGLVGKFKELSTAVANSTILQAVARSRLNNNAAVNNYEADYYNDMFAAVDTMLHESCTIGLGDPGASWNEKSTLEPVALSDAMDVVEKLAYVKNDDQWAKKKEAYGELGRLAQAFMKVFVDNKAHEGNVNKLNDAKATMQELRAAALKALLDRAETLIVGAKGKTQRTVYSPTSLMKLCARVEADMYVFARGNISFSNVRAITGHYQSFLIGYLDAFGYLGSMKLDQPFVMTLDKRKWMTMYLRLEDMFENPVHNKSLAQAKPQATFKSIGPNDTLTDEEAAALVNNVLAGFVEDAGNVYSPTTLGQQKIKEDLQKVNDGFFVPLLGILHTKFAHHVVPRDRFSIARGAASDSSAFAMHTETSWSFAKASK